MKSEMDQQNIFSLQSNQGGREARVTCRDVGHCALASAVVAKFPRVFSPRRSRKGQKIKNQASHPMLERFCFYIQ